MRGIDRDDEDCSVLVDEVRLASSKRAMQPEMYAVAMEVPLRQL